MGRLLAAFLYSRRRLILIPSARNLRSISFCCWPAGEPEHAASGNPRPAFPPSEESDHGIYLVRCLSPVRARALADAVLNFSASAYKAAGARSIRRKCNDEAPAVLLDTLLRRPSLSCSLARRPFRKFRLVIVPTTRLPLAGLSIDLQRGVSMELSSQIQRKMYSFLCIFLLLYSGSSESRKK